MAKKITTIPAVANKYSSIPNVSAKKRRVAGYARVSTDTEEQATSYDAQMKYYTEYISSRLDWEFVGMYSDEGISGTNTKNREGFKRMIDDALDGKIDLIITKSVSRFARNTVDSLTMVRKLKEKGVEIYFEKENIWTLDAKGELLITIMSSLAQEESRSISENTTWGKRKAFADGKASIGFRTFLGYDKGPNGEFVVNKEQAETVKYIYKRYLEGATVRIIGKELMAKGIKSPAGSDRWHDSSIYSILKNEKYKGDALLQKTYTKNYLTHEVVPNNGEVPQYYVEGHHEAIITPEQFDLVQAELERRKRKRMDLGYSIFSSIIKCGECGGYYGPRTWHSNDKYRRIVYICGWKYKGDHTCRTPHFSEEELKDYFVKAVNKLLSDKRETLKKARDTIANDCEIYMLEKESQNCITELNNIADYMKNAISDNSRVALDQEEYAKRYNEQAARYEKVKAKYERTVEEIEHRKARKIYLQDFIKVFREKRGLLKKFDEEMWTSLLHEVIVNSKEDITFVLKCGFEVKA